jgi:LCP family protein required for cell wall assembly
MEKRRRRSLYGSHNPGKHFPAPFAPLDTRRPSWKKRIGLTLLILFGFGMSGGVGAGIYFLPAIETAFSSLGQHASGVPNGGSAAPLPATTGTPAATNDPALFGQSSIANGQPFTMLLLGSDNDSKFEGDHSLTQSMILVRVDPTTNKVTMLSIPRDLWVPIGDGGSAKIDAAYSYGGAQEAIQTVEENFHVHVDHYAWVGLEGLVKIIDQVGGVDVVASNPVVDDFYPADLTSNNPFNFHRVNVFPGPQHMTGLQALEYVRSRHGDLRGDFGRSARQQQVLLALRAKAKLLGIGDLPDIAAAINGNFKTDVSITDVSALLPLAGSIPLSNVTQVTLQSPYTSSSQIGDQDVLLPNWYEINTVVAKYFPVTQ